MQGNHPESYSLHHPTTSQPHTVGGFNFPVQPTAPFTIKIPSPMQLRNRNSIGSAHSVASGSEYHESNASMDLDGTHEEDAEGEDEEPQSMKVYGTSLRGRRVTIARYKESDSEPDPLAIANYDEANVGAGADFDEEEAPRPATRRLRSRPNPVVLSSDDGETGNVRRYSTRSHSKKPEPLKGSPSRRLRRGPPTLSSRLQMRDSRRSGLRSRRTTGDEEDADGYVDVEQPNDSADDSMEDAVPEASSDLVVNEEDDADAEGDVEVNGEADDEVLPSDGKPYALRQRVKVNYAIPPPLDEIPVAPPKPASGRHGSGRSNWNRGGAKKGPGWSANGAELSRFLGLPGEDSVCSIHSALPLPNPGLIGFRRANTSSAKRVRKCRIYWWS
jgi:hypothetical protein